MAGRRSIITAPIRTRDGTQLPIGDAVIAALEAGAFAKDACAAAGITEDSFYTWLKKGQELAENPPVYASGPRKGQAKALTKDQRAYVAFAESATRARARATVFHVETITTAAQGTETIYERDSEGNIKFDGTGRPIVLREGTAPDWRASGFYLERTDPKRWGKRIEVDTDPGERTPEPLYAATAQEAEAAFVAANVPEGLAMAVLPSLDVIEGSAVEVTDDEPVPA